MRTVTSQFGEGPLQQKLSVGDLHFLSDAEPGVHPEPG